jgi:hypothetical protein
MRLSFLFLLPAVLVLGSCAGRGGALSFFDGSGGRQRVRPAAHGPAGEGRFALRRAVPVGSEDRAFYLRFAPAAGSQGGPAPRAAAVELRVLDPQGGVLARRAFPAAGVEVRLLVPVPRGARIAGFALDPPPHPQPVIREAGLTRAFAGVRIDGGLISLGLRVRGLATAPGAFEIELEGGEGRSPLGIELDYELFGPVGWADLRRLEAGARPDHRAAARLEGAAGSRSALLEQNALPGPQHFLLYPSMVGFDPVLLAMRPLHGSWLALRRLEIVPHPAGAGGSAGANAPAGASGWASAGSLRGAALAPLPADPATVLLYDPSRWRQPEYELFSWERFPGVLILDTADYEVQDRFFKRLAFFVEKRGYRGRLVSDQEVAGRHGYNAHDYRAEDLARFFRRADAEGFRLNREEELLRSILTANGLLRPGGAAGSGAVLSISRSSGEQLRLRLLTHEALHGLFFTLPRYRDACAAAWRGLSAEDRKYWSLFLDWGGYDISDEYLSANEMQAYLFQQPRSGLDFYFRRLSAGRLEGAFPREAAWLRGYLAAEPHAFERTFDRLEQDLRREAHLEGGRVIEWRKLSG